MTLSKFKNDHGEANSDLGNSIYLSIQGMSVEGKCPTQKNSLEEKAISHVILFLMNAK